MPARAWIASLAAAFVVTGCYVGVEFVDDESEDTAPDDSGGETDQPENFCLDSEPSVGASSLRRLTRRQYRNTVRDLLGFDADAWDTLEADERVGPFANNATIPPTETGVALYMDAAEILAEEASKTRLDALVSCDPSVMGAESCARVFIEDFGRRALRRPLSNDEVELYTSVYSVGSQTASSEDPFVSGVGLVIEAMLQSPDFLYIVEVGEVPKGSAETDVRSLKGHELATRLSYFLWNSTPDDELLDIANELRDSDVLESQTRRMLEHERARETIADFHTQLTGVDTIGDLHRDPDLFPMFSEVIPAAMAAEVARFSQHVFYADDARLETLLTAPYTLIDEELFAIYGLEVPANHDSDTRVMLDGTKRSGLLTLPGFLAAQSHPNQTSPVHRGLAVRERLLCQTLPPPPPEVDNVPPPIEPGTTTAERFARHQEDPACAECHVLIDGIGLGFEHYDAVGAWRTKDGGVDVDARGELVGTGDANGRFYGAVELGARLANSSDVRHCMVRQWFRYGLGRLMQTDDACSLDSAYAAFEASDFDLRELVVAVVLSPSFRKLRMQGASEGE